MALQGPILQPLRPMQAPTASSLDSLIAGIQQGNTLANLPQILSQQEAQKQSALLNQQLQNLRLQQEIEDYRNPGAAYARQAQQQLMLKSIDPRNGILAAREGINVVGGVPIALPGTVTPEREAQIQQDALRDYRASLPPVVPMTLQDTLEQPTNFSPVAEAFPEPIAPFVAPNLGGGATIAAKETPSAFTLNGQNLGYIYDPNVQEANAERELALKSKYATNNFTPIGMSADGKSVVGFNRATGNVESKPVPQSAGSQGPLTALPGKGGRGTGSTRELTPNARMNILNKAATYIDVDDPKYFNSTTGEYNYTALAIDGSKASRQAKIADNELKANGMTGATKDKVDALNAADKQLSALADNITTLASSGSTPGFFDSVIAVATAAPADGIFSALWNKGLKSVQSDESQYLEGQKSIVRSALTQAISGLAVTLSEDMRLQFLPRPEDSFLQLMNKVKLVEDYIKNQREGLGERSQGGQRIPTEQTSLNSGTPAASTSGLVQIRSPDGIIRKVPLNMVDKAIAAGGKRL